MSNIWPNKNTSLRLTSIRSQLQQRGVLSCSWEGQYCWIQKGCALYSIRPAGFVGICQKIYITKVTATGYEIKSRWKLTSTSLFNSNIWKVINSMTQTKSTSLNKQGDASSTFYYSHDHLWWKKKSITKNTNHKLWWYNIFHILSSDLTHYQTDIMWHGFI